MARRRRTPRSTARKLAVGAALLVLLGVGAAALLAGSPGRLPEGTTVGGVDVGGLEATPATRLLEERSARLQRRPVEFVAGGKTFELTASQLGIRPDWGAAVRRAVDAANGVAPVRGLKRLESRLFGSDFQPTVDAYPSVLRFTVAQIASSVDRAPVDASLRRQGLAFRVGAGRPGSRLDRDAAAGAIVAALASLQRSAAPVRLPVVETPPRVIREQLAEASQAATTAVSRPVTLTVGPTRFRLPRWRIARFLDLPRDGETRVRIGGPEAESWFASVARAVGREPRDATFRVVSGGIELVPAKPGRALDVDEARRAVERAIFSRTSRAATVGTTTAEPARTTAEASAMGITGVVGSYTTTYGGTPGRIHNVQLVAELIDGALIAPGERFSFNETTGERNEAKGFEEAPVIINGELQTGIGGGVCQVSTTVFNAAFEAGLSIERRTNHALYISHYPLGRDATVNYPDIDLVFRNDTSRWLLLRTFVNAGSLTVNLYGTPQNRRVETETTPLVVDGKIPIKRVKDPKLLKGKRSIEVVGQPPRKTSVRRKVFDGDGTLLYDSTWRSYYVGEPTIVHVGTKKRPKPEEPARPGPLRGAPIAAEPVTTSEPTPPQP
jgi:vancomycin resistance protein YoaR